MHGKILSGYGTSAGGQKNDGIDIAVEKGTLVFEETQGRRGGVGFQMVFQLGQPDFHAGLAAIRECVDVISKRG